MPMLRRIVLLLCSTALALGATAGVAPQTPPPIVVLISLDGFRSDYLERFDTPMLHRLMRTGVRAEYLRPVFPTKTYPNHYTIVTGLYPDHHGIVMNEMWDPVWSRRFDRRAVGTQAYDEWWGGEPIWVTARRQGLVSSTMFWPGSDAEIGGVRPNDWQAYDGSVTDDARVARVLEWLDRSAATRPAIVTLYLSDTDDDGHRYGPDSPQVGAAVRRLDAVIGRLTAGLGLRGKHAQVDLIVLSDHGMTATPRDKAIVIDDVIDLADVEVSDWTPVLGLWPKTGREDKVDIALRRAPHLSVFRRGELPARWRLGANRRVPPLLAVADEGWTITDRAYLEKTRGAWNLGNHGYDNALPSMRAIFLASGPHFKQGLVVPAFENVDVYELMCRILGLTPAPNDGQLSAVAGLLRGN